MGASAEASRSGDLLNDIYELHELLEQDELQQVYRARDTRDDRAVRVALLRPELALRAGVAQSFVQAPKALHALAHPNLARVLGVESDATGIPFIVEEEPEGEPLLRTLMAFPDGMPLGVAMNLFGPVIDAVAAAHALGVAHGALGDDSIRLVRGSVAQVSGSFVRGGDAKHAERACAQDARALGELLYRALSGRALSGAQAQPLEEVAPHLPLELCEVVDRCLKADSCPRTAAELAEALGALRQRLGAGRASTCDASDAQDAATRAEATRATPPRQPVDAVPEPVDAFSATVFGASAPSAPGGGAPPGVLAASLADVRGSVEPAGSTTAADPGETVTVSDGSAPAAPADLIVLPKAGPLSGPVLPSEPEANPSEPRAHERLVGAKPRPKAKPKPDSNDPAQVMLVAGERRLAAAFGPLDGASIEQGEAEGGELVRAFRASMEDSSRSRRKSRAVEQDSPAVQQGSTSGAIKAKPADRARQVAPEVFALAQRQAAEEERARRRKRVAESLLLLLFGLSLVRAVPVLGDPSRELARELLGTHVKLGVALFTALSVVVLIRTWAMQISSNAALLRPVTYALKVVVAAICLLGASFFLPAGSLGPAEGFARRMLPWGSLFFFLFLGVFGLMRGLEAARANAFVGALTMLLYAGSFAGSYAVAASTIVPQLRGRSAQAARASIDSPLGELVEDHQALADGVAQDVLADAGYAESGHKDRTIAGGSEESDLESIRAMQDARKHNSARLNDLGDKVPKLTR